MKFNTAITIYSFHNMLSFSYLIESKYMTAAKIKYNAVPNINISILAPLWANAKAPTSELSEIVTIDNKIPIITYP